MKRVGMGDACPEVSLLSEAEQEQYKQEIDLGLWQIEGGETISDEDMQKEINTW